MGCKLDLSSVMESKVGSSVVYGTAGVTALYVAYKLYGGDTGFRTSIFKAFNCGNLNKTQVKGGIDSYEEFFTQEDGQGVGERKFNTPKFVDTFYNLITDFYEYGWGQSFHFAPRNRGESFDQSIIRHELKIADQIKLKPGMKVLDAGCGVGGPMRAIAKGTGGNVVGITINDYQVSRCKAENAKAGLSNQCDIVQGSFLEMPFPANSFDGCYCIEAACHAPDILVLYKQIYKVMKPGTYFSSYEWLTTPLYDINNPKHVRVVDDIAEGNALPSVRSIPEIVAAGNAAGFELAHQSDEALGVDIPWQAAMKTARRAAWLTDILTYVMEKLWLAPKGTWATHQMLLRAAWALEDAGNQGVFTPMYMVTFRKPL
mmetsp:Transcript_36001/g.78555  ORF Transcript_36001/g.78555 Transcript_36001/m.78555 type:complete len:372 (-) Transcript_36001:383-1498(-)|eukprot:CAMPEP_0118932844 /NCGR_PEP_ID=MMETSP1169-20130426/10649_1 /TAXON_ID=36882 /ORGANISM="Pyramimonas obovata, Strain CCMP722" /LENGTH=371 /DNA_ID=CAMNT_0006875545 /DNA_START=105 /DNA_END=1220 /DNA_ORIENTATION=+